MEEAAPAAIFCDPINQSVVALTTCLPACLTGHMRHALRASDVFSVSCLFGFGSLYMLCDHLNIISFPVLPPKMFLRLSFYGLV